MSCILLRTAGEVDFLAYGASDKIICFLVWPLPETATGILCNCLVGAFPYTHYHTG